MEIQEIYQFLARGHVIRGKAVIPVVFSGYYPKWSPGPVRCKVVPEPGKVALNAEGWDSFEIQGVTEQGMEIWVPRFRVTQSSTTFASDPQILWEGEAEFFVEGYLKELESKQGYFSSQAFVPCTPLITSKGIQETNPDGTIKYWKEEKKGEEITWRTDASTKEWRLTEKYEYEKGKVGVSEALIRLRRCQVDFRGALEVRSLKVFAQELEAMLEEPLWLLSFLSHQRMHWYEAHLTFSTNNEIHMAKVRRRQWLGYGFKGVDIGKLNLLVKPNLLAEGLFQKMYHKYLSLPIRPMLRNIMSYIIVSYEEGYFETRLAMLYTALESLVSVLGEGSIVGSAKFKRLRRKLESVINEQITDSKVAASIIKKLPELKRRAFAERLLILFEKNNLDPTLLWPPGADIRMEIEAMIKRRNEFIHKGKIEDWMKYSKDFVRLQNLLELWILQMIGYPLQEINSFPLRELQQLL